jgi:hypothetical protein
MMRTAKDMTEDQKRNAVNAVIRGVSQVTSSSEKPPKPLSAADQTPRKTDSQKNPTGKPSSKSANAKIGVKTEAKNSSIESNRISVEDGMGAYATKGAE